MKYVKLTLRNLFWLALVIGLVCALLVRNRGATLESPHAEALLLVLQTQGDRIQIVEGALGRGDKWWHDTGSRVWMVKRAFAPGYVDSTHLFDVQCKINENEIASWLVDTRRHSVQINRGEEK